ncbi:hypothetical protein [Streptomyces noursei]|uniref:hypothetical protein n=1 Tax=Streptomyces noursei TaxID=1971 RepID=UPI0013520ED0
MCAMTLFPTLTAAAANPAAQNTPTTTTVWAREAGVLLDGRFRLVDYPGLPSWLQGFTTGNRSYAYPDEQLIFFPSAYIYGKQKIDTLVLTVDLPEGVKLTDGLTTLDIAAAPLQSACKPAENLRRVTCAWHNIQPIAEEMPSWRGFAGDLSTFLGGIDLETFKKDPLKVVQDGAKVLGNTAPFSVKVDNDKKYCDKVTKWGNVTAVAYSGKGGGEIARDSRDLGGLFTGVSTIVLDHEDGPAR